MLSPPMFLTGVAGSRGRAAHGTVSLIFLRVSFLRRAQQSIARLAQSAERKALNLVVVGSSPTMDVYFPTCFDVM